MKIQEIYKLAINKGIEADFRGREEIENLLKRRKEKYEKLSEKEKEDFDLESFNNPYSDTRILNVSEDKEIKKILVGVDIEPAEILLAKEIGDIDLVISHHPLGNALAGLSEAMEIQADVLSSYGVPINIAEGLLKERMSEVFRNFSTRNLQRTVDTAKLLGVNLICLHTPMDNLAAKFLEEEIEKEKPGYIEDLLNLLKEIPEYKKASEFKFGPQIFVGDKENRCGKIALTEITGGSEASPKIYEKMANAGVGTIVSMHQSEENRKEAEAANINVVIAGHMSSDSLGMNLLLDDLEKQGIEIIPCSGLIRISRLEK